MYLMESFFIAMRIMQRLNLIHALMIHNVLVSFFVLLALMTQNLMRFLSSIVTITVLYLNLLAILLAFQPPLILAQHSNKNKSSSLKLPM